MLRVRSRGNQGLDSQVAFSKHCPNNSIVFLLHFHERLGDAYALEMVADELKKVGTFGAFLPLLHKNKTLVPQNQYDFSRERNYLRNNLNERNLNELINHFRVFESGLYRLIPKFELHRVGGDYYEDRLIYLMTILELASSGSTEEWNYIYF